MEEKRKSIWNKIGKFIVMMIGICLIIDGFSGLINTISKSNKENNDDENSCYITKEEFKKIQTGMTYEEVKNIIGCDGDLSTESSYGESKFEIYGWYAKDGISNATFSFMNGELSGKNQIGLKD